MSFNFCFAQQIDVTQKDARMYSKYKKSGDEAYGKKQYGKAMAEYQNAKQFCKDCSELIVRMDSCRYLQKQRNNLNEERRPTSSVQSADHVPSDQAYYQKKGETTNLAPHGFLTQFYNMDYNYVTGMVQRYMNRQMNMAPVSDDLQDGYMIVVFEEKASYNTPPKALTFKFKVRESGNDYVVEGCNITGDKQKLIGFYLSYWNTKMKVDETQTGLVANTKLLADECDLYLGSNNYIEVKGRL